MPSLWDEDLMCDANLLEIEFLAMDLAAKPCVE